MLEKLKEAERYNETDAANTVHKIVDALVYLHSKGIAHRDLKVRLPLAMLNCVYPLALYSILWPAVSNCEPVVQPENILLTHGDDAVKIVDFGFAKVCDITACGIQLPS
eukprot:COSAG02_NODE_771_length_17362_cov_7.601286_8_plen_109_part_00